MYKSKLSPEQALETIKLRMKYDSSKTLNENIGIVNEQGLAGNPMTGQASGGQTYSYTQKPKPTPSPTPVPVETKKETKPVETKKETTTKKEVVLPSELKDVKAFQDWLDTNKKGWAAGYADGIVNKGRGYGTFGPRTKKAWDTYKDEFLKTPTTTPTPAKSEEEEAEAVYGDNPSDIIASN